MEVGGVWSYWQVHEAASFVVKNGTPQAKLQSSRLVPSDSPWPIISLVPKVLESLKQGHHLEIKSTNT